MSVYTILAIVFAILLIVFIIRREVYDKKVSTVGIVLCAALYGAFVAIGGYEEEPTALDVYRGKTTLKIVYNWVIVVNGNTAKKSSYTYDYFEEALSEGIKEAVKILKENE